MINCLAVSADGAKVAIGLADNQIYVLDARTGIIEYILGGKRPVQSGSIGPMGIHALCFSPDGTSLASGGWDEEDKGAITLWSTSHQGVTTILDPPQAGIVDVLQFSPDGKDLLADGSENFGDGSSHNVLRLWDVAAKKVVTEFVASDEGGIPCEIENVKFSPNAQFIAFSDCSRVWIAEPKSGGLLRSIPVDAPSDLLFGPDGSFLYWADQAGNVSEMNLSAHYGVRTLPGKTGSLTRLMLSVDGCRLWAWGGHDKNLMQCWRLDPRGHLVASSKESSPLNEVFHIPSAVYLFRIFSSNRDGAVVCWAVIDSSNAETSLRRWIF